MRTAAIHTRTAGRAAWCYHIALSVGDDEATIEDDDNYTITRMAINIKDKNKNKNKNTMFHCELFVIGDSNFGSVTNSYNLIALKKVMISRKPDEQPANSVKCLKKDQRV